jgi:UTP--glucose-1-phosphate uridylyltransferase
MTIKPLRKAVFPVAGLGTRFLPATKAMPKEMLTVVDKPLIQYAVEEALEAGIEQIIFVTGRGKGALEDHFDISYELEDTMRSRGKSLDAISNIRMSASRSRSAWVMRCGVRARSSATNRSRSCSPMS